MRILPKDTFDKAATDPVAFKQAKHALYGEFFKRYTAFGLAYLLAVPATTVLAFWGAFQLGGMWPLGIAILLGLSWKALGSLAQPRFERCPTWRELIDLVDQHRHLSILRSELVTYSLVFTGMWGLLYGIAKAGGSDACWLPDLDPAAWRVLAAIVAIMTAYVVERLLLACMTYRRTSRQLGESEQEGEE